MNDVKKVIQKSEEIKEVSRNFLTRVKDTFTIFAHHAFRLFLDVDSKIASTMGDEEILKYNEMVDRYSRAQIETLIETDEKDRGNKKELAKRLIKRYKELEKEDKEKAKAKLKGEYTIGIYWDKLMRLLKAIYKNIKKGVLYMALGIFVVGVLLLLSLILTGAQMSKFIKLMSDIVNETISKIKRFVFTIIRGVITFNYKNMIIEIKKIFKKYMDNVNNIYNQLKAEHLDAAFKIIISCTFLSMLSLYFFAKPYVNSIANH